ncbi:MAG: hypothetical protein HY784_03230 [Chloroflexi bacterium]|nr:hypothetical protein [Chloroflexota bacterium]
MQFNVIWTTAEVTSGNRFTKGPDRDNRAMYLLDDLGRRYDHIATDGAARDGGTIELSTNPTLIGSFTFPSALPGASTFAFHDDDQHVVIGGIRLSAP